MTKADIVKNISDQTGVDKTDVQMIAEKFMEEIKNSLENNNNVYLRGFGSFRIRQRNARVGRNPKSGQKVDVPSKKVPFFKAGKELRELVDEREAEEAAREEQENQ